MCFNDWKPSQWLMHLQHIPPDMTFNPDATPPQYSNGQADVIEKGSAVRLQIIGMRSDVGAIYAIGKMSGVWFGYV
jgi:DNA-directed RNA polymerase II subunit RPB7